VFPACHETQFVPNQTGEIMDNLVAKDWRELSKAASQERDSEKLMQLIEQLNDALDKLEHRRNALGSRAA
jgi:hypothetical protein